MSSSVGPVINILLIDDHTLFREGLHRMLDTEPGLRVCADFSDASAALAAVRAGLEFHVALVDFELVQANGTITNGLELVQRLRQLRPDAQVLMVTGGMETPDLVRAVRDLNAGVFLKAEPTAELLLAIRKTARGERWVSSGAALALVAAHHTESGREVQREMLSARESAVLHGVLEGLSNKEIGARLDLTESSVKAVLQKLFEKTGVRTRSQLVRYAIETQSETR